MTVERTIQRRTKVELLLALLVSRTMRLAQHGQVRFVGRPPVEVGEGDTPLKIVVIGVVDRGRPQPERTQVVSRRAVGRRPVTGVTQQLKRIELVAVLVVLVASHGRTEQVVVPGPRTIDRSFEIRNHRAVVGTGEHAQFHLVVLAETA